MNKIKIEPGDYSINDIKNIIWKYSTPYIFLLHDVVEQTLSYPNGKTVRIFEVVGGDFTNTIVLNLIGTEQHWHKSGKISYETSNSFHPVSVSMEKAKLHLKITSR